MITSVCRGLGVVLLMLFAACDGSGPTLPTPAVPPAVSPPPASRFPPLSGSSRTFVFQRGLSSYPVGEYTKKSRFVLYDNGAFVLLDGWYRGGYSDSDGAIRFDWEGSSGAGPWAATGTLQGDSLAVRYNIVMQMTDFEDAEYVLAR